ncbi:MAG: beta-galactosidase GalB, partial [Draconibacterium sp.]|nr:beta-galactosidase GalB [Draconibacterium sp.]
KGLLVNGEHIPVKGVNQHHDLGCLGAAFNIRAAERQLEILQEMGCNAIRTAHNPPAPDLLDLCDEMGFLVIDEIFDVWERKKTPHDFHLIFPDWYEADTRSFIRRDRNHPSVISWSFGNEVGEQFTDVAGVAVAKKLYQIVKDEDSTRPATASMNFAKPHMPFSEHMDIISLNYQGEGIRNAPAYKGLKGINTPPLYPAFHEKYPDKLIVSSENAAALSSRGTYFFPVSNEISAPVKTGDGGDPINQFVSSYELYTAPFGSSADKVFASLDKHPYVAGGFIWSGWDYLGEPTPYYSARSSYYGVIDLAGFKKDRFYLYQSHWRPDYPMVHILPHWNWQDREGKTTPVHVFTSGDEAELFINGKSQGRKKKGEYEYRLRWDDIKYESGEIKAVAYKNGEKWAEKIIKTTEEAAKLEAFSDRNNIKSDGKDLAFITVEIHDKNGLIVPTANNEIIFSIEGPGKIIATDNGDPRDLTAFPSLKRNAFNGFALVVIQSEKENEGTIIVKAESTGLNATEVKINCKSE